MTDVWLGAWTVATNAAIVPAIVYAWRVHAEDGAALFTILWVVSSLYHFCQAGFWCVFRFETLQRADHFFVYTAITWTVVYAAGLVYKHLSRWRNAVVYAVQAVLFPLLLQYAHRWWFCVIVAATIVSVFTLAAVSVYRGAWPKFDVGALIIATALLAPGFAIFYIEGEPDSDAYPYTHGAWHVLAMLGIFFVLRIPNDRQMYLRALRPLLPRQK
jgi:hypothetical protein